jgi:hypothetical protein
MTLSTSTLENICLRACEGTDVKFAITNTRRDMPDGTLEGECEVGLFRSLSDGGRVDARISQVDRMDANTITRAVRAAVRTLSHYREPLARSTPAL